MDCKYLLFALSFYSLSLRGNKAKKYSIGNFAKVNSTSGKEESGVFILEHLVLKKGVILKITGWCHRGGDITFQLWRPKVRFHSVFYRLISEFRLQVENYPGFCQVDMASDKVGQIDSKDGDRLGFFCGHACPLAYEPIQPKLASDRVRILREKQWSGRTEIAFMAESRQRLYSLVVTYNTVSHHHEQFPETKMTTRSQANSSLLAHPSPTILHTVTFKDNVDTTKMSTTRSSSKRTPSWPTRSTNKQSTERKPTKENPGQSTTTANKDLSGNTSTTTTITTTTSPYIDVDSDSTPRHLATRETRHSVSKEIITTTSRSIEENQSEDNTSTQVKRQVYTVSTNRNQELLGANFLVNADGYLSSEANLIHVLDTSVYILPADGVVTSLWAWLMNSGPLEFQIWRMSHEDNNIKVKFQLISRYEVLIKDERGMTEITIPKLHNFSGRKGDVLGIYNIGGIGIIGFHFVHDRTSDLDERLLSNGQGFVTIGRSYFIGQQVSMTRNNRKLDVTTGLQIEFCFAAVFLKTINSDITNKTTDLPVTSPIASMKRPSPWWTNRTLVISLIAWLLGVTVAMAIACTLISWRKNQLNSTPGSSSGSVNEYKPRSIRNRTAFSQWIGGMRADETIDYYMPSIAARSNHRSVSFARTRPTTIETPATAAPDSPAYDTPSRTRASSPASPAMTRAESTSTSGSVERLNNHRKHLPLPSITALPGTPTPIAVAHNNSITGSPSYSSTPTLQAHKLCLESPHITRLKTTLAGYNTKM